MPQRFLAAFVAGLFAVSASLPIRAELTASDPAGFALKHQGTVDQSPERVWVALVDEISQWWHPDHTYSGDAANLSLEAKAGGVWREDWDGGSVFHGEVLLAQTGKTLRLDAPFGPLQEMGVSVVWTITLTPDEDTDGTKVTFTEIANGTAASKLDELAPAVDFVKTEAMTRLTAAE